MIAVTSVTGSSTLSSCGQLLIPTSNAKVGIWPILAWFIDISYLMKRICESQQLWIVISPPEVRPRAAISYRRDGGVKASGLQVRSRSGSLTWCE